MYYIFLENEKLNGAGQCKRLDCENIETTQEIYEDYKKTPNKYTWEEKEVEVEVPDFETVVKTIDVKIPYYETIDKEIEVEEPVFETVVEKVQVQVGEDEDENPILEEQELTKQVQIGTETRTETVQEKVVKFKIEQHEVKEIVQIGSHTENKTIKVIVLNPDYEKEEEEKVKERIKSLTCTKRVFALMLQELGISYKQLKELIESNEQAKLEWELCVELLRGNPLLDLMAVQFGITSEQIDRLFQYANGEITIEEFKK